LDLNLVSSKQEKQKPIKYLIMQLNLVKELEKHLEQDSVSIKKIESATIGKDNKPALFVYTTESDIHRLEHICRDTFQNLNTSLVTDESESVLIVCIADWTQDELELINEQDKSLFLKAILIDFENKIVGRTYLCPECHSTDFEITYITSTDTDYTAIDLNDLINYALIDYTYNSESGQIVDQIIEIDVSDLGIELNSSRMTCSTCGYTVDVNGLFKITASIDPVCIYIDSDSVL